MAMLPKDVEEKLLNYIISHHFSRAYDILKNFSLSEDFIVDTIVTDDTGRALWKRYFPNRKIVPWEEFVSVMKKFMKSAETGLLDSEAEQEHYYKCLFALMKDIEGSTKDHETHIPIENFAALLKWFGPLDKGIGMLVEIRDLLNHRWFHGCISEDEACRRLNNKFMAGNFLVRLSKGQQGCFVVSLVNRKDKIKHYPIYYSPKKACASMFPYCIKDTECRSLLEAVMLLGTFQPCIGYKFARLFLNS